MSQSSSEYTHRIRKSQNIPYLKNSLVQFFLLQKKKMKPRESTPFSTRAHLICGKNERRTLAFYNLDKRRDHFHSYYYFSKSLCQLSFPSPLTYRFWSSCHPLAQLSGEIRHQVFYPIAQGTQVRFSQELSHHTLPSFQLSHGIFSIQHTSTLSCYISWSLLLAGPHSLPSLD